MPNVISELRVGLATWLREQTDLAIYTTAPEEPGPDDDDQDSDAGTAYPLVYVLPSEPYLDRPEGTPFGWWVMHVNVSAVAAAGTSDKEAEQLDGMLSQLIAALTELDDWEIGEVLQPGTIVLGNDSHLACPIELHRLTKLS